MLNKAKTKRGLMTKKDDMSLDLDFNDISEKDLTKPSKEGQVKTRQRKPTKPIKRIKEIQDTLLSIPISNNPLRIISKSISECSGKEFVEWSNSVAYPLKPDYNFYSIEENRVTAFLRVAMFHKKSFILSNPKNSETIH